ncbi:M12 family metallo-peptidase [Pedobacter sp. KACC 23697]|uniref:M12 family metallo-peptidase n=1 Tax=Pedobacter sp. KACC 23697 TaxID=3149230 RepID=A0AAU7K0T5_9SPHI
MKSSLVKFLISSLLVLCFFDYANAQENIIYEKIQNKKADKGKFVPLTNLFSKGIDKRYNVKGVKNINDVEFFDYSPKNLESLGENLLLILPLRAGNMNLELIEVPAIFYNFKVVTSDRSEYQRNKKIRHYRGIIQGDKNSIVTISFIDNEVIGLISNKNGNFNLTLNRNTKQYTFIKDTNSVDKSSFNCLMQNKSKQYDAKTLQIRSKTSVNSDRKCVRFYLETEYDIFQDFGNVGDVEAYISAMMNQVSALYENENIETSISEIYIWTTPDPYTGTTTDDLLNQFQNHTNSINGDLGQLLTFRNVGGGKAAGFNGLCNSNVDEKLSVAGIYNFFNQIPAYSWTVMVVTHEFGHLFGSHHTQACVWNWNNTAIDGCASSEGGCSDGPMPTNGGTIMSYCHLLPNIGINFSNGFGSQPGNVIRNSVVYAACLSECFTGEINGKIELCDSEVYSVSNIPAGANITWGTSNMSAVNISGTGNSVTVIRNNSFNGEVVITATISNLPYAQTYVLRKGVQVGVPNVNYSGRVYFNMGIPSNPLNLSPCEYGGRGNFEYLDDLGNSSELTGGYEFEVVNDLNWYFDMSRSPIGDFEINPAFVGTLSVPVRVKNNCGWSLDYFYLDINVPFCSNNHRYTIYPNPVSQELYISSENINIASSKNRFKAKTNNFEVKLLDNKGNQLKKGKTSAVAGNVILDVSSLPDGIYFLHIFEAKEVIKKQIIIKH